MQLLTQKDERPLMEYMMAFELECYMLISNLTAARIQPDGRLRSGEYYMHGDSIMAVFGDGTIYAYMPDASAEKPFAEVLREKSGLSLITGTPVANLRALDRRIFRNKYRYELEEACGACLKMPNPLERRGYSLQRLYADDRDGFDAFGRIYNTAQDEELTTDFFLQLAKESYGSEAFFLGRQDGSPCFVAAAQYQTPSYMIIGKAGVLPEFQNYNLWSITLYTLAHEYLMRGFTPIVFASKKNIPSYSSVISRGLTIVEDTQWYFSWFQDSPPPPPVETTLEVLKRHESRGFRKLRK